MATKTTPKKKPAKKRISKPRKASKSTKASFISIQPETEKFMTFRITRQTVYWLTLGAVVVLFSIWILRLQSDIQSIYDTIEMNQIQDDSTVLKSSETLKKN